MKPPEDFSYDDLVKYEKIIVGEPLWTQSVVTTLLRFATREITQYPELLRALQKHVTPAMLRRWYDSKFDFEPDIELRTFNDLRAIIRADDTRYRYTHSNRDIDVVRLESAAKACYLNMFNAALRRFNKDQSDYKSTIDQAYSKAVSGGHLQIIERCIELGADQHVGALCVCDHNQKIFDWISKRFPTAAIEYENLFRDADE